MTGENLKAELDALSEHREFRPLGLGARRTNGRHA